MLGLRQLGHDVRLVEELEPDDLLPEGADLEESSNVRDEELRDRMPVRVYVDLDPAFTLIWHEFEGVGVGLEGHTHFATVGLEPGSPECPRPCARTTRPTRVPPDGSRRGSSTPDTSWVACWIV